MAALKNQIRSSTASMTSIPKAMKFLQPHYEGLKDIYELMKGKEEKVNRRLIDSLILICLGAVG